MDGKPLYEQGLLEQKPAPKAAEDGARVKTILSTDADGTVHLDHGALEGR
jgi:hypothetical protein